MFWLYFVAAIIVYAVIGIFMAGMVNKLEANQSIIKDNEAVIWWAGTFWIILLPVAIIFMLLKLLGRIFKPIVEAVFKAGEWIISKLGG